MTRLAGWVLWMMAVVLSGTLAFVAAAFAGAEPDIVMAAAVMYLVALPSLGLFAALLMFGVSR